MCSTKRLNSGLSDRKCTRRKFGSTLAALVALFASVLCSGCKYSAAPYYGELVVADEQGIWLVNLPSMNQTLLLPTADSHVIYGHPTLLAPDVLIFSSAQRLVKFDLGTREFVDLGRGVWPTYVPEHRLLFFWQSREGEKQRQTQTLMVRSLNGPANEKIVASFYDAWISRIVRVSPDEVAFYGADSRVWTYSLGSSILAPTQVERCLPLAWRSKTQQLICQDIYNHNIYLSYLDGRSTAVPFKSYDVLGYSPTYDAIICSTPFGSPWELQVGWAIVAYNFRDRKIVRLAWVKPSATGILLDTEGNQL